MCGIGGFAGRGNRDMLERMGRAIERRGPDDAGFYEADGVGFAFRRLSIIDIEGGHQPLSNEDGTVWVMLNGEIYNFVDLRDQLEKKGHVFKTKSDTEVIVHGYEMWGDEVFTHLDGMFAISIWDTKLERLILARDRIGKKPVYWTQYQNTCVFASELKALSAAGIPKKIRMQSVYDLFRTDSVPTPSSIFQDIEKLKPATAMAWKQGRIEKQWTFWTCPPVSLGRDIDEADLMQGLRQRIDAAVARRLVADVPLGLFLSGGIDSSVIAESAARQAGHRLRAFTLGFEDATYDERDSARQVARALGIELHEQLVRAEDGLAMIEEMSRVADEPLSDPAIIPQLQLSKFAKQQVTVALTGDGGDELLLGYPHLRAHEWHRRMDKVLPMSAWRLCADVLGRYPSTDGYFSRGFKLQRLARGLTESNMWGRDVAWRGSTTRQEALDIFQPEIRAKLDPFEPEKHLALLADEAKGDWRQQWSWGYMRSYLLDTVLVKVDRATMWHGIEARSPILDTEVVRYILSMDSAWKSGSFSHKQLFKRLLEGRIPSSVLDRPKHGFGVPIASWLRGPLEPLMRELMDESFIQQQGIFHAPTIQAWWKQQVKGRPDRRKEIWTYLVFQLWYRQWMN